MVKLIAEILFDQAVAKTVNQFDVRPFLPLQRRVGKLKWLIFLIKSTLRQEKGANTTFWCGPKFVEAKNTYSSIKNLVAI